MIGIYMITNNITNKSYIGQSINIQKRVKEHFYKAFLEKDISYHSAIESAIRKYGKQNFTWKIIQECSVEEIDNKEQYYIKKYNTLAPNGYNILEGGQKIRILPVFCSCCGKQITKQAITGMCNNCYKKTIRKVERPSREQLKQEIRNIPFTKIAEKYKVSNKAIVKWCIYMNLPSRKKDIRKFSDKEWENI